MLTEIVLLKEKLTRINYLDQSSLDFLETQYKKLKFDEHDIKIVVYSGGEKTFFHSLDVEALIFLLDLMIRKENFDNAKR